ncbi:glycerophosphodiester phosphodiesterase [Arthrobacter sp. zg-Y820]|uniref:glycerophosphodiester phosphodiesterase n=1 Tax=unclassified Arthrobacter TaxID=235627 RepID=UPI002540FB07|nr:MULTISPECIES: glycerophosphodiester phosphodiesterase [unclassified Arthrobacter]MCC9197427.1 glycerophosphodiester phosphodiesterase [Arthrobacter sp. zg-Y820]MDK1280294.1 glycerophosphodiester phosphodiesterase [Arthrobacter sp. zg.Y820]WIB09581.1 glycerophosphodiester phosphodiesterase [Arthrobacter sp. zg-Y820]
MRYPYFDSPPPLGLAHRGFSREGRENTLVAFRAAAALGFGYLETDVRTTRDGVLLAFHDASLDRVAGAGGPVGRLSLREVRRARVGGTEEIPTVEELLTQLPEARLNVDVKDAAGAAELARLLDKHAAHDRVLVTSFSDRRRLASLRRLARPAASSAGAPFTALTVLLAPLGLAGVLAKLGRYQCLQVPERQGPLRIVTRRFVSRCHRAGLQVHVWTVNDPADMERLLDLGVDGLVSDRADLLADVLSRRGVWPQRRSEQAKP